MEYKLGPKGIDDRPSIVIRGTTFYAGEMVRSDRIGGALYQLIFKHNHSNDKFDLKIMHYETKKIYDIPRCGIIHDKNYFKHGEKVGSQSVFMGYIISDNNMVVNQNTVKTVIPMKSRKDIESFKYKEGDYVICDSVKGRIPKGTRMKILKVHAFTALPYYCLAANGETRCYAQNQLKEIDDTKSKFKVGDNVILSPKTALEYALYSYPFKSARITSIAKNYKGLVYYIYFNGADSSIPFDEDELSYITREADSIKRDNLGKVISIDYVTPVEIVKPTSEYGAMPEVEVDHNNNLINNKNKVMNKFEEMRNSMYFTNAKVKQIIKAEDSLRASAEKLGEVSEKILSVRSVLVEDCRKLDYAKNNLDTKAIEEVLSELKDTLDYVEKYGTNTLESLAPIAKAVKTRTAKEKFES